MACKVVAIVQARMGSSRLPGKIFADLAGEPVLARCLARLGRIRGIDEVVVATTTSPRDDRVAAFCRARGLPCFRGRENDVLDRYYRAARRHAADVVVRITSDCPLIDPEVSSMVLERFFRYHHPPDYCCNFLPRRTFPLGLETEVFTFEALVRAWRQDHLPQWREHVTTYILHRPARFSIASVRCERNLGHLRWTVDTPEDLDLVRRIYRHFGHDRFSWRQAASLIQRHPSWQAVNRHVRQVTV